MRISMLIAITILTAFFGCGSPETPPQKPTAASGPPPAPPPKPAAASPAEPAVPPAAETPPPTVVEPSPDPEPVTPATVNQQVAKAGVGKKGRYGGGIISTPVSQMFRSGQRLVFDVQIPKSMQIYKAQHGKAPSSHEEFMEKIIKANLISLPELPPGDEYYYDPETEKLMVRHPSR